MADRPDALIVSDHGESLIHRQFIVDLDAPARLPTMYFERILIFSGGLMGHGADPWDGTRQAAIPVDRILKGANPGKRPFQQATKFEFLINLKTAKALGLAIPRPSSPVPTK